MEQLMSKTRQSVKSISLLVCLVLLNACSTPSRYLQASEQGYSIEKLASAKKCDEAIKSYDKLKSVYPEETYKITNLATSSVSKFPQCLIAAGRAEEVIRNFEKACLSSKTPFTAQQQTYICVDYDLKDSAAPAYKAAGRENPFEKNPDIQKQIARNADYIAKVDAAISNIYKNTITASGEVGTSAGARRYYTQMKSAATQSIALVDAQVPRCKAEQNALCLKFLAEKRREEVNDAANWSKKLNESIEDHEAAQKIAGMAPALLSAVGTVGAAVSRSGTNATPSRNTASPTPAAPARQASGWIYDDINHGRCVSVRSLAPKSKTGKGYGHYELINSCAYPIKLLVCANTDRADGTPSCQDPPGAKCPGGGWGGTELQANETKDNRTWFEFNNIKWEAVVCRIGWSFVAADGESYPKGYIGERYRCRKRA